MPSCTHETVSRLNWGSFLVQRPDRSTDEGAIPIWPTARKWVQEITRGQGALKKARGVLVVGISANRLEGYLEGPLIPEIDQDVVRLGETVRFQSRSRQGSYGGSATVVTRNLLIAMPTQMAQTMPSAAAAWLESRSHWQWKGSQPLAPSPIIFVERAGASLSEMNGLVGELHLGDAPTESIHNDLLELAARVNPSKIFWTLRGKEINRYSCQ